MRAHTRTHMHGVHERERERQRRENIKLQYQFVSLPCVLHPDIFYSTLFSSISFKLMDQDENLKNTDLAISLTQYKNHITSLTDFNPAQSLDSSVFQEDEHFPMEDNIHAIYKNTLNVREFFYMAEDDQINANLCTSIWIFSFVNKNENNIKIPTLNSSNMEEKKIIIDLQAD